MAHLTCCDVFYKVSGVLSEIFHRGVGDTPKPQISGVYWSGKTWRKIFFLEFLEIILKSIQEFAINSREFKYKFFLFKNISNLRKKNLKNFINILN